MLPTTRSRCQQVVFQSLPDDFVVSSLARLRPDADKMAAQFAARYAGGSLGAALRCLDDGLFELKRGWVEHLAGFAGPGRGEPPHLLAKPFIDDAKTLARHLCR